MGDINADVEVSRLGTRDMVKVSYPVSCMGRIGFQLEFGSGSDVRANAKLSISFTMRCG